MKTISFALIATLAAATPAVAAGGVMTACAGDIQKFCAASTTRKEEGHCLNSHKLDLSSVCTAKIAAARKAREEKRAAAGTHM